MKELEINPRRVTQEIVDFVRLQLKESGKLRLVVGISGGLDSSVTAALSARAAGPENVWGLILPARNTSETSINHANAVVQKFELNSLTIRVDATIEAYFSNFPFADRLRIGNKVARERMSILYDQSLALDALVVGTSNKTERLLGYGTIYGDLACAFNPIGDLYKNQVRQLARYLGIPEEIIAKSPSAELWKGQTDEGELGLRYDDVDRFFYWRIEKGLSRSQLEEKGFSEEFIREVERRVETSNFKRRLPPVPRISRQPIEGDIHFED